MRNHSGSKNANLKWATEGDFNTKFFHSSVNRRRRKLTLLKIKRRDGTWAISEEQIVAEATEFYQQLFSHSDQRINFNAISCLPRLVSTEENSRIISEPSEKELREVVFSLYTNSCPGPDVFNAKFYQCCWDIIKGDLLRMVRVFFVFWGFYS